MKTKKRFGFLLRNRGHLIRYLKHLVLKCNQRSRLVQAFRIDHEFVTEEIKTWCEKNRILLLPCIPYEHDTLGDIERDNRTIKECIIKNLASKPHLNEKYWGMCYSDILTKMDLMPCPNDPSTNAYENWYETKYDMLKQPMLDFGCIVMAHVPLDLQGVLSDRSIKTYYVGTVENGRHGGILLYNPITKHTIIRRSFRVMGPSDITGTSLLYEAAYEDNGNYIFHNDSDNDVFTVQDAPINDVMITNDQLINLTNYIEPTPDTLPVVDNEINKMVDSVTIDLVNTNNNLETKLRRSSRLNGKVSKLPTQTIPSPLIVPIILDNLNDNTQFHDSDIINDEYIHQYGNDYNLENDPIPLGSRRKLRAHMPELPNYLLAPDHFIVEKIINHKGQRWRPGSIQLYIK